jgi:hypothetical protein
MHAVADDFVTNPSRVKRTATLVGAARRNVGGQADLRADSLAAPSHQRGLNFQKAMETPARSGGKMRLESVEKAG